MPSVFCRAAELDLVLQPGGQIYVPMQLLDEEGNPVVIPEGTTAEAEVRTAPKGDGGTLVLALTVTLTHSEGRILLSCPSTDTGAVETPADEKGHYWDLEAIFTDGNRERWFTGRCPVIKEVTD